jgi:hypothetical protein
MVRSDIIMLADWYRRVEKGNWVDVARERKGERTKPGLVVLLEHLLALGSLSLAVPSVWLGCHSLLLRDKSFIQVA